MLNSQEALEILSDCANGETKLTFTQNCELYNIVLQDLDKLEKYKQLEKELGIDLELYINTHLKGVYVKGMEPLWSGGHKNEILHYTVVGFTKECLEVRYRDSHNTHCLWYPLEEYGKTWSLDKQTLEK